LLSGFVVMPDSVETIPTELLSQASFAVMIEFRAFQIISGLIFTAL
jgi:hypothetical protein